MRRYTTLVCEFAARFSSFDISHVKRNLIVVADNLAVYAACPDKHNLVERPDCSVISLYHPHYPTMKSRGKFLIMTRAFKLS